jgi:hypothetical protein
VHLQPGPALCSCSEKALKLRSPGGHIEIVLSVQRGDLSYEASMDGRELLDKAPLEIHADDEAQTNALHLGKVRRCTAKNDADFGGA